MRVDEIFIPLFLKKIKNATETFISSEIFDELLWLSRECNRERLEKSLIRQDLARKVDDIGIEVDSYLKKVRLKMLDNGKKGKNSLSKKLCSSEETIKWLIARWGNVFMNLATNKKYKQYIDVGSIGHELHENISYFDSDCLSIIINEEEQKEFDKQQKRMKKCSSLIEMVADGKIGGESSASGGTQMVFLF